MYSDAVTSTSGRPTKNRLVTRYTGAGTMVVVGVSSASGLPHTEYKTYNCLDDRNTHSDAGKPHHTGSGNKSGTEAKE